MVQLVHGPAAELVLLSGELDGLGVLKSPMVITSLKNIIDNLYHHSLFEQCGSCSSKYDTKPSLMVIGSNPSFRYVNFLNFLKKFQSILAKIITNRPSF